MIHNLNDIMSSGLTDFMSSKAENLEYLGMMSHGEFKELMDCLDNIDNEDFRKDFKELFLEKLKDAIEKARIAYFDISDVAEHLEDTAYELDTWKDLCMLTLPSGASVAMANDVEDTLDKFKNIY